MFRPPYYCSFIVYKPLEVVGSAKGIKNAIPNIYCLSFELGTCTHQIPQYASHKSRDMYMLGACIKSFGACTIEKTGHTSIYICRIRAKNEEKVRREAMVRPKLISTNTRKTLKSQ